MTREELAAILFEAYQRTPDQCFLAMADAAIKALQPTLTPNDDERRQLWRDTLSGAMIAGTLAAMNSTDIEEHTKAIKFGAKKLADAALAADAEKWGKP